MNWLNKTHVGDCRALMREMSAGGVKVQCIVTSPPYWGLRDYGVAGAIGLEPNMQEWLAAMADVFEAAWDVLADDGVLWLNLGDSYAGSGGQSPQSGKMFKGRRRQRENICLSARIKDAGLKTKDLVGQPWRMALALQEAGWYLRADIIWHKLNPMPESVSDRPTKAHEYVFLLTKQPTYYYDASAIAEPVSGTAHARGDNVSKKIKTPDGWDTGKGAHGTFHRDGREKGKTRPRQNPSFSGAVADLVETKNIRTVWSMASEGQPEAHFATFPTALVKRCILAGTKPGDIVLDPFMGSGTTARVAAGLGRHFIGCELNPAYAGIQDKIGLQAGMAV